MSSPPIAITNFLVHREEVKGFLLTAWRVRNTRTLERVIIIIFVATTLPLPALQQHHLAALLIYLNY
jgi:hypothetical protein